MDSPLEQGIGWVHSTSQKSWSAVHVSVGDDSRGHC
jgi:hypothetical protein